LGEIADKNGQMSLKYFSLLLFLLISSSWSILEAKYLDIGGPLKIFQSNIRRPASIELEWMGFFKQHASWNDVLKDYWTDQRFQKLEYSLSEQSLVCSLRPKKTDQLQCLDKIEWMVLKDGLGQYKLFLLSELAPNLILARDKMTIADCDFNLSDKACADHLIKSIFTESIQELWRDHFSTNFPKLKADEIIFKDFFKYQNVLVPLCQQAFKEDDKDRCSKHIEFAVARAQLNYWSDIVITKNHEKILKDFKTKTSFCFEAPFRHLEQDILWERLYNFELSEYSIIASDCLQNSMKELWYFMTLSALPENLKVISSQLRIFPVPLAFDLKKLNNLDDALFEEIMGRSSYREFQNENSFETLKLSLEKNKIALAQDYALDYLIINLDEQKFRYVLHDAKINGAIALDATAIAVLKDKIRSSLKGSELITQNKLTGEKKYFTNIIIEKTAIIEAQLKYLEWPLLRSELAKSGLSDEEIEAAGDIFMNYENWAKSVLMKITDLSEIKINVNCFNKKENLSYNVLNCLRSDLELASTELIAKKVQDILAESFARDSSEYRILNTEVALISSCYREVFHFISLRDQWQQISNCAKIVEFDLAHNIDRGVAFSFTPLILQKDWQKIDENLNYCYGMSLMETKMVDFNTVFLSNKKNHQGRIFLLDLFSDTSRNFAMSPDALVTLNSNQQKLRAILKSDLRAWPSDKTNNCRKETRELTFKSFQEFVVMNFSGEFQRTLKNKKGEEIDFILKSLFNVEFMDLLMSVPEVEGENKYVTRKKVLNALSNSILKLSAFMQRGFIFDREKMKTELVVMRGQMIEFLEYVKGENRLVEVSEIKDFFAESSLPEFLAVSFLSEMLHEKFMNYMELRKTDALSRLVHDYPSYGQVKKQIEFQQKRQELLTKFKVWEAQGDRLFMAHDFRRVMNINSEDTKNLLIYLKKKMIPEIVMKGKLDTNTERDFVRLASEIFIKDTSRDGIVGILARQYLQELLDGKKSDYWFFSSKDSWWLTKKFFTKEEAFDWDSLAQSASGQEVLDFYVRFLFFPDFIGDHLPYDTKKSLEEVFKSKLETVSKKMR